MVHLSAVYSLITLGLSLTPSVATATIPSPSRLPTPQMCSLPDITIIFGPDIQPQNATVVYRNNVNDPRFIKVDHVDKLTLDNGRLQLNGTVTAPGGDWWPDKWALDVNLFNSSVKEGPLRHARCLITSRHRRFVVSTVLEFLDANRLPNVTEEALTFNCEERE